MTPEQKRELERMYANLGVDLDRVRESLREVALRRNAQQVDLELFAVRELFDAVSKMKDAATRLECLRYHHKALGSVAEVAS